MRPRPCVCWLESLCLFYSLVCYILSSNVRLSSATILTFVTRLHVVDEIRLMLEQESATERPGHATWQSLRLWLAWLHFTGKAFNQATACRSIEVHTRRAGESLSINTRRHDGLESHAVVMTRKLQEDHQIQVLASMQPDDPGSLIFRCCAGAGRTSIASVATSETLNHMTRMKRFSTINHEVAMPPSARLCRA